MKFNILDSASFDDAMQDVINKVVEQGINTQQDNISVFMTMNGNFNPDGSARVDSRLYVNETPETISNDIALNDDDQ
jgi:hypothetical protein